jgi:hypothetical protein
MTRPKHRAISQSVRFIFVGANQRQGSWHHLTIGALDRIMGGDADPGLITQDPPPPPPSHPGV